MSQSKWHGRSAKRGVVRWYIGSHPCPRGCGARWYRWGYQYPSLPACCKTWWKRGGASKWCPAKNKACATYRIEKVDGKWVKHGKHPAWAESDDKHPVRSCC